MVKNKYRQKKAPAESNANGPKKTPIVSPHEFDGLIGFEEVQDYTLIKGRYGKGKSTKQVFKDGKLQPKPKRIRNRKPKRPREEKKENNTDDVDKTSLENSKENKDNTAEVAKKSLDNKKENDNNESKKEISAKEVFTESSKNNKDNKSKKDVSEKELDTNSLKNSKKDTLNKKEKKKKKSEKDKTAKKVLTDNVENSKNDKLSSKKKKKIEKKKLKNKKRNMARSSVDSAIVEKIITDDSGTEAEKNNEDNSPSQKRKSEDEPSTAVTAPTSKKARYNTSVYKGTSDGKKVDISAWKDIFTPELVMDALADLGFSQPTEIQRLTLPAAIKGRKDIVGAAETGSGKTLAFGIPIIHGILHDRESPSDNEDDDSDSGWEEEVIHDGSQEIEADNDLTALDEENKDANKKDDGDLMEKSMEELSDTDEKMLDEDDDDSDDEFDDDDMEIIGAEGELEVMDPDELAKEIDADSEDEDEDIDVDEDELGEEEEEVGEEILEPLDESGLGCVKVINNVSFDFLDNESGKVKNEAPLGKLRALIVTPTRELAMQVKSHLDSVLVHTDIQTAVVVGGMSQQKQERLLRRGPEIVVGTPGRLWEMVQQGNRHLLQLPRIRYLAIDETDRMLERGHFQELHDLLELINSDEKSLEKRQTFVFSATLSIVHTNPQRFKMKKKAVQLTSKMKIENLMKVIGVKPKPKIVDVTRQFGTAEALTEARINCSKDEKDYYLYYFLRTYPGRTLVFCNSIDCVRRLQNLFTILNCEPQSLHASMHQKQRLKSLERFTSHPRSLLLATDVAARGLDIPLIQHVIHYQVPRTAETYVHRSGRTARATQEGLSILMVDSNEVTKYRQLCTTLNRATDLPPFPTDLSIMSQVKKRVNLGREVEKMEHTNRKSNAEDNWFRRAAMEAELHFEEEELDEFEDRDRTSQAKKNKQELKVKRAMLKQILSHPLISANFSGKYPTKTGGLLNPLTDVGDLEVTTSGGNKAINVMKKEKVEFQNMLKKVKVKAPVKKVNKKKNKGFEKRRLKKEKEQKEQLKAMEQGKSLDSGSSRRRGGKKDSGMETFSC